MSGPARIEWRFDRMAFVCTEHGETLAEHYHSYSRHNHMPLHVHRCKICGAESEPAIHADLGL